MPAVEKRQGADEAGMAAEVAEQFSGVAVPDLHGAVLTRRGDPPAVGAEGHGINVPAVPSEGLQLLAGLHVPDLDRVLFASRHQPLAVRAERHGQTTAAVTARRERAERFLRLSFSPAGSRPTVTPSRRRSPKPGAGRRG